MATETTVTSARAWSPDVTTFAAAEVIPDALILTTSTVSGSIDGDAPMVRVGYVDDASAAFVAEGAPIDESNPALSEILIATSKVSMLVRVSAEQWHQGGAATQLSESVRRAVVKTANLAYLTQVAPTPPAVAPAAGLLNVAGIEAGDAVAGDLDSLIALQATIAENGGQASHILLSPSAWASLRTFKTATGSAMNLLGAGTEDTTQSLLNLPVIISPALPTGTGLMIDKSAVVSAVGQVEVAQSEHVYFASDSIALRATWRFGQNVVRPNRIGSFTVTAPA